MDLFGKLAKQAVSGQHQQQQQQQQQTHQQPHQQGSGDLFGKLAGGILGGKQGSSQHQQQQQPPSGGNALFDKLHGLAGGGPQSEKKEDALDKGVDWVQENVFKQGPQHNESAAEQAKDKFIADAIRDQFKKQTGKDFPGSSANTQKKSSFPF